MNSTHPHIAGAARFDDIRASDQNICPRRINRVLLDRALRASKEICRLRIQWTAIGPPDDRSEFAA